MASETITLNRLEVLGIWSKRNKPRSLNPQNRADSLAAYKDFYWRSLGTGIQKRLSYEATTAYKITDRETPNIVAHVAGPVASRQHDDCNFETRSTLLLNPSNAKGLRDIDPLVGFIDEDAGGRRIQRKPHWIFSPSRPALLYAVRTRYPNSIERHESDTLRDLSLVHTGLMLAAGRSGASRYDKTSSPGARSTGHDPVKR